MLLRPWRRDDEPPFAALNADARVTEYLLGPLTRAQSDAQIESYRAQWAGRDFGRWAVELPGEASCIGMVGLSEIPYEQHFTPSVEIAWRLAYPYWGRGLATEAARDEPQPRGRFRAPARSDRPSAEASFAVPPLELDLGTIRRSRNQRDKKTWNKS